MFDFCEVMFREQKYLTPRIKFGNNIKNPVRQKLDCAKWKQKA